MRKSEVTIEVKKNRTGAAQEALRLMDQFTDLCLKYKLDIVRTDGAEITLRGRPRRVTKFEQAYQRLPEV